VHVTQSLTEALETTDCACGNLFVDASVFFDARGETNHLAQSVDNDELAV
jgi:hypothetical protein